MMMMTDAKNENNNNDFVGAEETEEDLKSSDGSSVTTIKSYPPHIAAAIEFCLATDDVFFIQLGTEEELKELERGDGGGVEKLSFCVSESKAAPATAKTMKYLGSPTYLPSTEILRLRFFREDKVVGQYDIRLLNGSKNHQEDDETSLPSSDSIVNLNTFPCWRISPQSLASDLANEFYKVLRHCSVDVLLSDEDRKDPDVVLFDTMEAYFVKSFIIRSEGEENSRRFLDAKLQCCVLTMNQECQQRKQEDREKSSENRRPLTMNFIRFSLQELEERGKRGNDREESTRMMSAM